LYRYKPIGERQNEWAMFGKRRKQHRVKKKSRVAKGGMNLRLEEERGKVTVNKMDKGGDLVVKN